MFSDPRFLPPWPALEYSEQGFKLITKALPCCHGRGYTYESFCDRVHVCSLSQRLAAMTDLRNQYKSIPSFRTAPEPCFPEDAIRSSSLKKLHALHAGIDSKGLVFLKKRADQDSGFWAAAFTSIWRFGIPVLMFSLTKNSEAQAIPDEKTLKKLSQISEGLPSKFHFPCLYFVRGVSELWEEDRRSILAGIIDWCEKSCAPLFLELVPNPDKAVPSKELPRISTVAEQLKRRVETKLLDRTQKNQLSWLDTRAKSQLSLVCHGAESFF